MGMPQIYQTRDFKTEKLKELYGANPSRRQLKRFNKYINSEQGQKDWLAFEDQESDKYFKSWDDRKAARFKQWDEQVSRTKSEIEKMGQNSQPAEVTTPAAPTPPIKKTESSGITPQDAYGLLSSVQSQLQGIRTYNSGVTLGSSLFQTRNQNPLAGKLPGLNDYAESSNDELKPEEPKHYAVEDLYNSKNFRKHALPLSRATTIDGVQYPVVVSSKFKSGENNHSFAFDSKTGKIRKLRENGLGVVGAFGHWEDGYDWVDPSTYLRTETPKIVQTTPINRYEYKNGGTMNRVKYFQQGGQTQTDIQRQVEALVEAAMTGDQKATQQVNQILEAAKAGDQKAAQLAQMIQVAAQKLQGQATMNKWGSKLTYIKSLKFAKGGKHTCPACEQKVEMKKCGGKKVKKHWNGGDFYVNDEKNPMKMSDGTRMVGVIHKQGFKNGTNRGMSQTLYDSTGKPIIQKDRTSNGGEREIYYNSVRTPIKREGLFSPGHVWTNDTVYLSGTPEMFENAPNMSTAEIKNRVYRFAQGMD